MPIQEVAGETDSALFDVFYKQIRFVPLSLGRECANKNPEWGLDLRLPHSPTGAHFLHLHTHENKSK